MEGNTAIMWKSFKQNQDLYYRDKLLSFYRPFLKNIVNFVSSKIPATVDRMDLESYGFIGLIDAINKFDIDRNIKFETYASYRIKGAIVDGIRKQDWLSKSLRSKCKNSVSDCGDAIYSLEHDEEIAISGQFDNDGKVSNKNISSVENQYVLYSLDDPDFYERKSEESFDYVENLCSEYAQKNSDFTEKLENRLFLKKVLSKLQPLEKRIVYLYYFKGLTFKQIGRRLNVTESRISQINKQIMDKIRLRIKK
jgi:RNA polymerase sigma factor FliA